LRLFSFGGYGLALAALALVVFDAYDSCPLQRYELSARSYQFLTRTIAKIMSLCLAFAKQDKTLDTEYILQFYSVTMKPLKLRDTIKDILMSRRIVFEPG